MQEKTTEERRGVYIVTTPDNQEHRAVRTGYREMMRKLRGWFPDAQFSIRYEEVDYRCGSVIPLNQASELSMQIAV